MTNPTRSRRDQKPHILDFVITNEKGMVYDLDHQAPLGTSDHAVLSFSLNCYMERQTSNCAKRHYDKGNYMGLRNALLLDWETMLRPLKDPDTQFNYLNDKIQTEIEMHISSNNL